MLVKATITSKRTTDLLLEIPDGEYTEQELKELADNDELLSAGEIVEEYDSNTEPLGTNIYEIDGKAV